MDPGMFRGLEWLGWAMLVVLALSAFGAGCLVQKYVPAPRVTITCGKEGP